ncbi:MAG: CarD family transcriptional regulator [Syntrophales bacterium]|jgi:CarD family transcriptional regulator|nr:CarD family transcriptional regulator [Syntrophales bacterium]MDY0043529.1 CarD family transcriptional regulator [Syntrophales bacterium]
MFKIGDMAVYPAQGVGIIEAIETRQVMGNEQSFYVIKILGNNAKIMIPKNGAQSVGLREVISEEEIPRVYEILRERRVMVDKQTWNKRYKEYWEKIKTGSVYEIAAVLRDLLMLKVDKDLSFGERKMMDIAKNLLVMEISIARDCNEELVEKDLNQIFAS